MKRDYNYRRWVQERIVKRRILNIAYRYKYDQYGEYQLHTDEYYYNERHPDGLWYNYLGKYTRIYRKSNTFNVRKRNMIWCGEWLDKYHGNRASLKNKQLKEIDNEIGERYYIFNKQ